MKKLNYFEKKALLMMATSLQKEHKNATAGEILTIPDYIIGFIGTLFLIFRIL